MVKLGSGSEREIADIMLTRYLIDQNGDPRKEEIAFAQYWIREINKGRQNVSIELFVKTMYQAKHFAKESETEFTESKLVEILKLTRYKESLHHGRIKTTLEKAFYTAKESGIIKGYSLANDKWGNTKYIFRLA